ncbi:hypothetical protein [Nocardioides ungokensis]|uniref:hypothetical protein n=1 Tax=Nocardioides ungokensis TaxID=1643322 RepID=UPI001C609BE1
MSTPTRGGSSSTAPSTWCGTSAARTSWSAPWTCRALGGRLRAWDEHGVYLATGRGATAGRVLRVPADALRDLAQAWFPLATHLIEGLYSTARSIESTARHRESW